MKIIELSLVILLLVACDSSSNNENPENSPIYKIKSYAQDSTNNPQPTLQDYIDVGVSGITADNLSKVNALVDGLEAEDVDTVEELDALTEQANINILPTAIAGEDATIQINESITLTGSGTDVDGTIIAYLWEQGSVTLGTEAILEYRPTVVGTDTLTFTVTDNDGATATDNLNIVVTKAPASPNLAPTANAGENRQGEVNQFITIIGSGTDSDGNIVSYLWKKGNTTLGTTAELNYRPTVVGTDILTLRVTDDDGATATDSIYLEVIASITPTALIPTLSPNDQQAYLDALNLARGSEQNCGSEGVFPPANPLTWSEKLYKSAYEHTQDLTTTNSFSHSGSGTVSDWTGQILGKNSSFRERIDNYGYLWSKIAENIVGGTTIDTGEKAVQKLLRSDGHCANIMNAQFTEVGMAMVKNDNADYIYYWTQNFAIPK